MPNKISKCRSCGKDIVWLKTFKGKNIPVDAESVKDTEAKMFERATMICHFETCSDPEKFRKKSEKEPAQSPASTTNETEESVPF